MLNMQVFNLSGLAVALQSKLICGIFKITTSRKMEKKNVVTYTDICLGTGLCLSPFVCTGAV